MRKFHITADGPKVCTAEVRDCIYGEHVQKFTDAQALYEKKISEAFGESNVTKTLKKKIETRGYEIDEQARETIARIKASPQAVKTVELLTKIKESPKTIDQKLLALDGKIEKISNDYDKFVIRTEENIIDLGRKTKAKSLIAIKKARQYSVLAKRRSRQFFQKAADRYEKYVSKINNPEIDEQLAVMAAKNATPANNVRQIPAGFLIEGDTFKGHVVKKVEQRNDGRVKIIYSDASTGETRNALMSEKAPMTIDWPKKRELRGSPLDEPKPIAKAKVVRYVTIKETSSPMRNYFNVVDNQTGARKVSTRTWIATPVRQEPVQSTVQRTSVKDSVRYLNFANNKYAKYARNNANSSK